MSGDTLSLILIRLCGNDRRINEIVKLNKLDNPNFIYVGQTLDVDCANSVKISNIFLAISVELFPLISTIVGFCQINTTKE